MFVRHSDLLHTIRGFKHLNVPSVKLWYYATPVIRAQVCDMGDSLWKSMTAALQWTIQALSVL